MNEVSTDKNVRILPEEVCNAIESLPLNKASGENCIVYEHLIFLNTFYPEYWNM
jgi:hypothetical protein